MDYLFEPAARAALPVIGSTELFPVRRVYCVGQNYAAHAREMGADPNREPPFFFCKASDPESVVPVLPGKAVQIPYPSLTINYHFEIELVVAIGKSGQDIELAQATDYIYGYAVGLDMTRRDLQGLMKDGKKSWEIGKAFDFAAPVGIITPKSMIGELQHGHISLKLDGQLRQQGDLQDMIWSVPEVIAKLSTYFKLQPGDLIFTGTPKGVGAVQRGQTILGEVDNLAAIQVAIV